MADLTKPHNLLAGSIAQASSLAPLESHEVVPGGAAQQMALGDPSKEEIIGIQAPEAQNVQGDTSGQMINGEPSGSHSLEELPDVGTPPAHILGPGNSLEHENNVQIPIAEVTTIHTCA